MRPPIEVPTPLEMFDALREATKGLPPGDDVQDQLVRRIAAGKLTAADLVSRGFNVAIAEKIISDFRQGSIKELGNAVGVDLDVDRAPDLIRREGWGAEVDDLVDDGQTLEEVFEELDRMRHPERYPQ